MILYEHLCIDCNKITDNICTIAERKQEIVCQHCGGLARRIISSHIERQEPTWLPDAINHAVPHGGDVRRPADRNEFNQFLRENRIEHAG